MADDRMIDAMQALHELGDSVAVPMKGGKSYVMVKDRIEVFRREFGTEFGIETNVDYKQGFDQGAAVVASARISDKDGNTVASGWAVEYVGSTKLTDASPVEVAETSAIGRALACFGLHGGEYASLNEMEAHSRKQEFRAPQSKPQTNGGPQPVNRAGPDGSVDPGLARQSERNRQSSQWYVPTDHDAVWLQPDRECQMIVDQVEGIGTAHELGKYWADLKPAIDIFKTNLTDGKDIIAEIKAAFATRYNAVGGTR